MTKQKAMEWAEKAFPSSLTRNDLATLFMEATEGLYRPGDKVQLSYQGNWLDAEIVASRGSVDTKNPFNIRPLPTKVPKELRQIRNELYAVVTGASDDDIKKMATDLGIDLEVEE